MMMSMLQNAFANPSSSLIQSRITGNLVFMLLPPLSHRDIFAAYVLAAVVRGIAVGICVWVVALYFVSLVPAHPLWLAVFAVLACGIMGVLGLIAGLWSEIRPARRLPELPDHAGHLPVRRVLFHPHAARLLARRVALEPHLLHHRRLPLRLLRGVRRLAVAQPGGGGGVFLALSIYALRLLASGYKLRN